MAKQTHDQAAKTLAEWARHWPFTRANPELTRRAQAAHRQLNRVPFAVQQAEPAPF